MNICFIKVTGDLQEKSKDQWYNPRLIITIFISDGELQICLRYVTKTAGMRSWVSLRSLEGDSGKMLTESHLHIKVWNNFSRKLWPQRYYREKAGSWGEFSFILFGQESVLNFSGKEM